MQYPLSILSNLISRRHLLRAAGFLALTQNSKAMPKTLPVTNSLAASLQLAQKARKPLLVMVSLAGCSFCKIAREHFLVPMYEQQSQHVVQINMKTRQEIVDFQGLKTTHDQLIKSWGITIAPTVLFFGKNGVEVAERLVGGYLPDYYGAYLEERLRIAQATL